PNTKYFYFACGLGWLLGIALLRGRARLLCLAAAASFVCFLAYSAVYLLLEGAPWTPPIPIYVEQCLLPLYLAAGVVGYWGALRVAAKTPAAVTRALKPICACLLHALHSFLKRFRSFAHGIVQRARIAAIRHGKPRFACWLVPLSRLLESDVPPTAAQVAVLPARPSSRLAALVGGLLAVAIIPGGAAGFPPHP